MKKGNLSAIDYIGTIIVMSAFIAIIAGIVFNNGNLIAHFSIR